MVDRTQSTSASVSGSSSGRRVLPARLARPSARHLMDLLNHGMRS